MGYIPPVSSFQLPAPAQINTQPGLVQGVAAGLPAGAKMAEELQTARSMGIANQYAPYMAQLKQQEIMMAAAKQKAEADKAKADAINGIGALAPVLKLLPIKNAKALLASHVQKLQSIYPDLPLDPQKITDDNVDEVEKWARGRPEIEKLGSPDALTTYDSHWISQMGETQRQQVADIKPVTPQEMFSQAETKKRTEFTQAQESQRASAGATGPLVGSAYSVNLAKTALGKGDELNDHIALNEFGKIVNNGAALPLPELQKMMKAGTWGPRFKQAFANFTGEGAMSDDQRALINNALDTFGQSFQAQTKTRTSQYPGATGPHLPSLSSYKLGQVVNFKQGPFKKVKDGPDTDSTTWQKVNNATP